LDLNAQGEESEKESSTVRGKQSASESLIRSTCEVIIINKFKKKYRITYNRMLFCAIAKASITHHISAITGMDV
jgi:hypothetical protein